MARGGAGGGQRGRHIGFAAIDPVAQRGSMWLSVNGDAAGALYPPHSPGPVWVGVSVSSHLHRSRGPQRGGDGGWLSWHQGSPGTWLCVLASSYPGGCGITQTSGDTLPAYPVQ